MRFKNRSCQLLGKYIAGLLGDLSSSPPRYLERFLSKQVASIAFPLTPKRFFLSEFAIKGIVEVGRGREKYFILRITISLRRSTVKYLYKYSG